ncbi:trinucleotide repeat-containing gene 18 protein [Hylobates moloch]|uniref:trinucleotide repeat-containing gene 18 protein n=1 Tax=Hylobates moloch TaxID=81572 RepID=UPI0013F1C970|nr:trinucleotide repeat-containing gene 18 protein [Hylobates moloch]
MEAWHAGRGNRPTPPSALLPPRKKGKSCNSSRKLSSKSLLTSDDYELGAGIRRRHKGPEEEHNALIGMGKARERNQTWDEHEASSDFVSQLKIKKKMASDQEQLANKLDKGPLPHQAGQVEVTLQVFGECWGEIKNWQGLQQVLNSL